MNWVNWLGAEIYFVHIGHGVLFWVAIAIVALCLSWWAILLGSPLIVFSVVGWLAEASIVLPVANRLLEGKPMMATATTRPDGRDNRSTG